jgi:hypothetical protein
MFEITVCLTVITSVSLMHACFMCITGSYFTAMQHQCHNAVLTIPRTHVLLCVALKCNAVLRWVVISESIHTCLGGENPLHLLHALIKRGFTYLINVAARTTCTLCGTTAGVPHSFTQSVILSSALQRCQQCICAYACADEITIYTVK